MHKKELEQLEKNLKSKIPLLGKYTRMSAIKKLVVVETPEVVPYLVNAVLSFDAAVAEVAADALKNLKNHHSIDALCKLWLETRNETLGGVIRKAGHVAGTPLELKVATALKTGKHQICDNPDCIRFLVKSLTDPDADLRSNSETSLRSLKNRSSVEALCEGVINGEFEAAKNLALEMNYLPVNKGRRSVFYVITGQIEKYLELDFEFQFLRPEYEAASFELQNRIRNSILRSNDKRLIGLFGEVRKKYIAKDLTEIESELMINVYARNNQMEELFALMFFIPLSTVLKALEQLSKSSWKPADESQRDLLNILLDIYQNYQNAAPIPEAEVVPGKLLNRWIGEGRKQEYLQKTEEELRNAFLSGTPAEVVASMTAMLAKNTFNPEDHELAAKHPHWIVRLVYITMYDHLPDTIFKPNPVFTEGGAYWFEKLMRSLINEKLMQQRVVNLDPELLNSYNDALAKAGEENHRIRCLGLILSHLAAFTLRNIIVIDTYEKIIENSANED